MGAHLYALFLVLRNQIQHLVTLSKLFTTILCLSPINSNNVTMAAYTSSVWICYRHQLFAFVSTAVLC